MDEMQSMDVGYDDEWCILNGSIDGAVVNGSEI
jgi:hypothetical protein